MKAVYISEHGGTSVLAYGDRPEPEIEPGEVMLKVRGSALNRLDIGMREGRSYRGPLPRIMAVILLERWSRSVQMPTPSSKSAIGW